MTNQSPQEALELAERIDALTSAVQMLGNFSSDKKNAEHTQLVQDVFSQVVPLANAGIEHEDKSVKNAARNLVDKLIDTLSPVHTDLGRIWIQDQAAECLGHLLHENTQHFIVHRPQAFTVIAGYFSLGETAFRMSTLRSICRALSAFIRLADSREASQKEPFEDAVKFLARLLPVSQIGNDVRANIAQAFCCALDFTKFSSGQLALVVDAAGKCLLLADLGKGDSDSTQEIFDTLQNELTRRYPDQVHPEMLTRAIRLKVDFAKHGGKPVANATTTAPRAGAAPAI